jgi:DNA invertase Pin-like site-specific DNA recombinase
VKFISYLRVSTQRQGQSGLGLAAQQAAVASYVRDRGELVDEVQEVESGRKGTKTRPQLVSALARCKAQKAALVIGKLDRLARDVRFFLEMIDDSGVDIRFADLPDICPSTDEGRMILVSMANFAEFEGRRISTRTKAALAAAKARGVVLGAAGRANLRPNIEQRQEAADAFAARLRPTFENMIARKLSLRSMVPELNGIGIPAPRGGKWRLSQVQRLLDRLKRADAVALAAPKLSST